MRIRTRPLALIAVAIVVLILILFVVFRLFLPFWLGPKGGVGIVKEGIYVITDEKVNSAICANKRWTGMPSTETEAVVCTASGIVPFDVTMPINHDPVIRFTPNRVYIFELRSFEGGYYRRFIRESPLGANQDNRKLEAGALE